MNHLCYADDLCLTSLSSSGMKQLLDICSNYAKEHSLMYNGKKSFSLCFKRKTIKCERPVLIMDKLDIPNVTQCRYIGITICKKNCDLDLKRQMKKNVWECKHVVEAIRRLM